MQIQPNLCTSTFSSTPQETRYHEGRNKQRGNNHYKTELCQHILNGKSCPHGAGVCMFAHSESERRQKIIPDYQRMITYRSRACFDCVATGKCPMGAKCNAGIHDYRVAYRNEGHIQVNLREFPEKNLDTDVHVDWFSKTKISEVNNGGPFNSRTTEMLSASFDAFSDIICNDDITREIRALTKHQRLQIALAFDEDRRALFRDGGFRYKATHKVYGTHTCMIVQTKHFIMRPTGKMEETFKIDGTTSQGRGMITVREIAFAQEVSHEKDSSIPAPALWFDIPQYNAEVSTDEDARLLKRQDAHNAKMRVKKLSFLESHTKRLNKRQIKVSDANAVLLQEPPFFVYYARESHCGMHDFITELLRFKVSEVKGDLASLAKNKYLENRFISIKRALKRDHWLSSKKGDMDKLAHSYHVPDVNGVYNPPVKNEKHVLWEMFVGDMNSARSAEEHESYSVGEKHRLRAMPFLLSEDELLREHHSRALRTKKGEERVVTSSKRFHEAFPLLTEMTKVVEHYNCISNSNNNKKRRATRESLTTAAHILTTAAKTKLTRICVV